MKQPKMSVVGGRGYDEIKDDLVGRLVTMISEHGLSQKVATKLILRDIWLEVERRRPFREDPEEYIRERLEEQVGKYLVLGFHDAAGLSKERFREELAPLINKTTAFFSPPAEHPIMDGEFSVLLVVPPEWVSIHWQVAAVRRGNPPFPNGGYAEGFKAALARVPEVAEQGKPVPREPYVLVGINGVRGFKDLSFGRAGREVKEFGYTYFSLHQLAQLLMVRPDWLGQSEVVALGEKYGKDFLGFTGQLNRVPQALVVSVQSEHSGVGIGKPYYTKMITVP